MSGGKKIEDHSFWGGSKPSGSVLPIGSKMKPMQDSAGDGHEAYYEDTAEAIHSQQSNNMKKAKSHDMKTGYRY